MNKKKTKTIPLICHKLTIITRSLSVIIVDYFLMLTIHLPTCTPSYIFSLYQQLILFVILLLFEMDDDNSRHKQWLRITGVEKWRQISTIMRKWRLSCHQRCYRGA